MSIIRLLPSCLLENMLSARTSERARAISRELSRKLLRYIIHTESPSSRTSDIYRGQLIYRSLLAARLARKKDQVISTWSY